MENRLVLSDVKTPVEVIVPVALGVMPPERAVHADDGHKQVVRYDRTGVWTIEHYGHDEGLTGGQHVSLPDAVWAAINMRDQGGTIFLGVPGGSAFDRRVRLHDEAESNT
jgi:hypothetical protein